MSDDQELTANEALRLFAAAGRVPRHIVGTHLDDEDLLALAEETMPEHRLAEAMRHVESCAACAEAAEQTAQAAASYRAEADNRARARAESERERQRAEWALREAEAAAEKEKTRAQGVAAQSDALEGDARRTGEPIRAVAPSSTPVVAPIAAVERRSRTSLTRTSWMAMAATVIVTLTVGGYAGVRWRRAAAETASLQGILTQQELRVNELAAQLAQAQSRATAAAAVAGFSLRPFGSTRGSDTPGPQVLPVPRGAAFVTLLIDLGPNPGSLVDRYEVVVTNPDLPDAWRSVVRPEPHEGRYVVAATAPRSLLPDGDYVLVVEATPASGQRRQVTSTEFSLVP